MNGQQDNAHFVRPEDIRGEVALKRYKEFRAPIYCGLAMLAGLFLSPISPIIGLIIFAFSLTGLAVLGLIALLSYATNGLLYKTDKIVVSRYGIALKDYRGSIIYVLPYEKVSNIRMVYKEHALSVAFNFGMRIPVLVQFLLTDGTRFNIPMEFVAGPDQGRLLSYLKRPSVSEYADMMDQFRRYAAGNA